MAKTQLSKHLLQMKFMQRTALRDQIEESKEERQHLIDDEHWVLDIPALKAKESRFHTESSYVTFEELGFGRMSFKGFNQEIERLHKHLTTEEDLARCEARERETGVDDEEMAHRYESLVGTIGKKFTKKRKKQMNAEDYEDEEAVDTEKKEKVEKKKKKFVTPEGANNEVEEQPATVTKKEKLKKKKKKVFLKPQEDD